MKRWFLLAAILAGSALSPLGAVLAPAALAQAPSTQPAAPNGTPFTPAAPSFSPDQRREIVQILREALKADPSILRDAVESLQAADEAQSAADTKKAVADHRQILVANAGDPVAGNPKGDITVVEFYDPRCPYCKRMLPSIDAILAKDPGVRVVYKDIPVLGPASVMESRAILAAQNQGAYLKMQAALMHSAAQPSEEMIRDAAKGAGIDPGKLVADMNGPAVSQKIQGNMLLAKSLKVQGTPVFIVGDTVIPGAIDQPQLEAAIADARRHAVN